MDEKKIRVRKVAAVAVLALLVGTLLSYFIITPVRDARTRAMLGDPDAYVTDTARSPWIYADENGTVTLYPEHMGGMTELVIPDAVNGVKVTGFSHSLSGRYLSKVKVFAFPSDFSANGEEMLSVHDCATVETLVFPEGVTDLSMLDIADAPSLKEIYFPTTLASICTYCVRRCGENVTVYYAGTEAEWRALGQSAENLSKKCTVVFETPVPKY